MRNTLKCLIIVCLICLFFSVSCNGRGDPFNNQNVHIQIDLSTDLNKEFQLSGNTTIDLISMDPDVLYAVNSSAFGTTSRALIDDAGSTGTTAGLLELVLGHYLAVPDEANACSFSGNEAGVNSSGGYASIVRFRTSDSDDMTIRSDTDPVSYYNASGYAVYEEYYHVDFNSAPYDSLDRSRIILDADTHVNATGYGASNPWYGFVTSNYGCITKDGSNLGVYDCSGKDYVNLFFTYSFFSFDPDASFETTLRLVNPVKCALNETYQVGSKNSFYYFSTIPGIEYYVVEIDQVNEYGPAPYHRIVPYKSDGSPVEDIYSFNTEGKVLIHKPSEDTYFSVKKEESESKLTVRVREASEEEIQKYASSIIDVNRDNFEITLADAGALSDESIYDPVQDKDVPAYINNDSIRFISTDGYKLNNIKVTVDIIYDDGSYAIGNGGYSFIMTKGVFGGLTCHSINYVPDFMDLSSIGFNLREQRPFSIKIRIEKAVDPLKNKSTVHHLFFVPNNGDPIQEMEVPDRYTFTVPHLVNGDKEYLGVSFDGTVYKEGEQINIVHSNCSLVAVWR